MGWGRRFSRGAASRLEQANAVLLSIGTVCLVVAAIGQGLTIADTGFDDTVEPWQRAGLAAAGATLILLSMVVGHPEARPTLSGFLSAPPLLTPRFVDRPELSARIVDALAARPRVICVAGMGGTGKSTLTAHAVRHRRLRRHYRHGIVWLNGSEDPLVTMAELAKLLGDRDPNFTTAAEGRALLTQRLDGRRILIVLDNVWAAPILEALVGLGATVLFTTRIRNLAQPYGIDPIVVDALTVEQALALLTEWVGTPAGELPDEALEVCRLVDHLALGVAMTAAMVARGRTWPEVAERIRAKELDRIGAREAAPGFPHASLRAAIDIGIEELGEGNALRRYTELGVFTGRGPIPRSAVEALWGRSGMSPAATADLLDALVGRSLVQTDGDDYLVHDLQLAVLIDRLGKDGLREAHRALVEGYRLRCAGGWTTLPDDGYSRAHIAAHLAGAGLQQELNALLTSTTWIGRRISAGAIFDLLRDFRLSDDLLVQAVWDALGMSWRVLARDPRELHGQLVWRLRDHEDQRVRDWVEQIEAEPSGPWLRPLTHARLSVAGHPRPRVNGWIEAVAVTPDGRRGVTGGDDGTVLVWDLQRPDERPATLGHHSGRVEALAVTPDGRAVVAGGRDRILRQWDLRTTRETRLGRCSGAIHAVAVTPDGGRVVTGGSDRIVRSWPREGDGEGIVLGRHEASVRAVAVTADSRYAISGSDDHSIWAWDLIQGNSFLLGWHSEAVRSIAVAGDLVVTAGDDRAVRMWRLGDPGASRLIGRHEDRVESVTFSGDGGDGLVISAGDDHTVRVWPLPPRSGHEPAIWTGDNRVYACAVTADGVIAAGDKDGQLHLLSLEDGPVRHAQSWRDRLSRLYSR